MQRIRIGFSHHYTKLYGQSCARLLDVKTINSEDIHPHGLDYDTAYIDPKTGEVKFFTIDPGPYLRMTFIGDKDIPFTTYRKNNRENWDKYVNNIGKWFEVYVKEIV